VEPGDLVLSSMGQWGCQVLFCCVSRRLPHSRGSSSSESLSTGALNIPKQYRGKGVQCCSNSDSTQSI
jgi:hypothetical protein